MGPHCAAPERRPPQGQVHAAQVPLHRPGQKPEGAAVQHHSVLGRDAQGWTAVHPQQVVPYGAPATGIHSVEQQGVWCVQVAADLLSGCGSCVSSLL